MLQSHLGASRLSIFWELLESVARTNKENKEVSTVSFGPKVTRNIDSLSKYLKKSCFYYEWDKLNVKTDGTQDFENVSSVFSSEI